MPPVVWFVPVALCCTSFVATRSERLRILAVGAGLLLMLLPDDLPQREDTWSSYQKLTPVNRDHVVVNNAGYQTMGVESNAVVDRVSMPYLVRRPPGDVLVVGARAGNDVAAALVAGARPVVAVGGTAPRPPAEQRRLHASSPGGATPSRASRCT